MGRIAKITLIVLLWVLWGGGGQQRKLAEPFSILDAINQAVRTHPGVGEAAADRRATEAELRQSQGALLPQIKLQADAGPEMLRQSIAAPSLPPLNNGAYLNGRQANIVVHQYVFDGFASINEIWRQ